MNSSSTCSNKVKLKITNGITTKRLSKLPDSFISLVRVVAKSQMVNPNEQTHCTIQYKDEAGDEINITEDDDLMEAYDVARESMEGQLKLIIKQVNQVKDQPLNYSYVDLNQEAPIV